MNFSARKGPREDIPNCWESESCPEETRESCPAHPNMGRECWKTTGTKCGGGAHEKKTLSAKILYCRNHCRYYRDHIRRLYP